MSLFTFYYIVSLLCNIGSLTFVKFDTIVTKNIYTVLFLLMSENYLLNLHWYFNFDAHGKMSR